MSWVLLGLLSAIFAALVAIFGKLGISGLDTTLATTLRSVVMTLFLLIISLSLGKFRDWPQISSKTGFYISLAGIAGAISWIFYFLALKNGPVNGVAALDRSSVLFVVLLSLLFLGESLTWKTGLGIAAIAIGALIISWK